jgi:hypothetical protein
LLSAVYANDTIIVHAIAYPPFLVDDEQSNGITGDLLVDIMSRHDVQVEFNILPPARVEFALLEKNYLASLVPPPKNSPDVYRFEANDSFVYRRLFRLASTPKPTWPPDPNRSIATLGFQFNEGPLYDFESLGGRIDRAPSIRSALLMLLNDRVDYVLAVDSAIYEAAESLNATEKIVASEDYYQKYSALILWINQEHPQAESLIRLLEME